jgi:adenylate cyclase
MTTITTDHLSERDTLLRWCLRLAVVGAMIFWVKQIIFFGLIAGDAAPHDRLGYLAYLGVATAGAAFEVGCWWWHRRGLARARFPLTFLLGNSLFLTSCYVFIFIIYGDSFAAFLLPTCIALVTLGALLTEPRATLILGAGVAIQYLGLVLGGGHFGLLAPIPSGSLAGSVLLLLGNAVLVAQLAQMRVARELAVAELRAAIERSHILEIFGQQVSPSVVDRLLTQKTLPSTELRSICVMFLDIRGFTGFAESKRPEEVITYLNTLWELLVDVINQHHGIVNKFLGDGFMATFGAPLAEGNTCRNAIDAALEIVATIERAVAEGRCPPTRIGIGLHAGEAVAGNVGSATRKEYTIIGDVVNLASRIEAMNKEFKSTLLCSREVVDGAQQQLPAAISLGTVLVRGHKQSVELLQLR